MGAVCARSRRALHVLLSLPMPHFQAAFQGGRRAAPVVHSETRQAERLATGLAWAAAESVTFLQARSWMLLQTFSWTEPTAACPCGRGECHRMRTGTAGTGTAAIMCSLSRAGGAAAGASGLVLAMEGMWAHWRWCRGSTRRDEMVQKHSL